MFYEIGAVEIVVYAVFHCARNPRAWKRDGTDNFAVERTHFARRSPQR